MEALPVPYDAPASRPKKSRGGEQKKRAPSEIPPCFGVVTVISKNSHRKGSSFAIQDEMVLIGSDYGCDIRIQNADVDRFHARIHVDSHGALYVTNLSKKHGTKFNNEALHGMRMVQRTDGFPDTITVADRSFYIGYPPREKQLEAPPVTPVSRAKIPASRKSTANNHTASQTNGSTIASSNQTHPNNTNDCTTNNNEEDKNLNGEGGVDTLRLDSLMKKRESSTGLVYVDVKNDPEAKEAAAKLGRKRPSLISFLRTPTKQQAKENIPSSHSKKRKHTEPATPTTSSVPSSIPSSIPSSMPSSLQPSIPPRETMDSTPQRPKLHKAHAAAPSALPSTTPSRPTPHKPVHPSLVSLSDEPSGLVSVAPRLSLPQMSPDSILLSGGDNKQTESPVTKIQKDFEAFKKNMNTPMRAKIASKAEEWMKEREAKTHSVMATPMRREIESEGKRRKKMREEVDVPVSAIQEAMEVEMKVEVQEEVKEKVQQGEIKEEVKAEEVKEIVTEEIQEFNANNDEKEEVKMEMETKEVVDYSAWKVNELKAELAARGLPTAGKKADLIARLTIPSNDVPAPATITVNFTADVTKVKEAEASEGKGTVEVDYAAWTVPQLKAELTRKGLSTAGRKADLLARIQEAPEDKEIVKAEAEAPAAMENKVNVKEETKEEDIKENAREEEGKESGNEVNYGEWTVAQLKAELTQRGMSVSGKKADLVVRLSAKQNKAESVEKAEEEASEVSEVSEAKGKAVGKRTRRTANPKDIEDMKEDDVKNKRRRKTLGSK